MSSTVTKTVIQHLTADELATRLRLPRWSVYEIVKTGAIPVLRIGRRIRFRLADVETWEASGGSPVKSRRRKAKRRPA